MRQRINSYFDSPIAQAIGTLLAQVVLGVLVGGLLALCGGWLGPLLTDEASNGWSDLIGSVLGALGGYALGAPLGVIVAAALGRQRGRPILSLLGGIANGVAILLIAEPLGLNRQAGALVLTYALVVLLGALGGFYVRPK